ncbi:MAG: SO2930 family diheme c-type cytochrome [Pseudomonadota bacterium]
MLRHICAVFGLLAAAACGEAPAPVASTYFEEGNPPLLSDWGQLIVDGGALTLGENVSPYDLNTALFTDYAHKLRTIWMPDGASAAYRENDVFDFPVGSVITKTFYYPLPDDGAADEVARNDNGGALFEGGRYLPLKSVRLIETRILVRRQSGWAVIPYQWNEEQTDAAVHRIGDIIPLTLVSADGAKNPFKYVMPDVNQCASCHAPDSNTRALSPIGPKARHLNRDFAYADGVQNQITHLYQIGYLNDAPDAAAAPKNAAWSDAGASVTERARAYLDINCSHCHSPTGPADTSGLFLEPDTTGTHLGICKLPIAAGAGTGDRIWGIRPGQPEDSILVYRMDNTQPDQMMPEIGRSTIHEEGVALVADWISTLEGDCG